MLVVVVGRVKLVAHELASAPVDIIEWSPWQCGWDIDQMMAHLCCPVVPCIYYLGPWTARHGYGVSWPVGEDHGQQSQLCSCPAHSSYSKYTMTKTWHCIGAWYGDATPPLRLSICDCYSWAPVWYGQYIDQITSSKGFFRRGSRMTSVLLPVWQLWGRRMCHLAVTTKVYV